MYQPTFADLEYEGKKLKTRREKFLERMDGLNPWEQLEERVRPFYPKAGRGRRPYELSTMLRIHCVQLFYNLSDPGMEDMLYEVESVRRFAGLKLSGPLPDETTILNFRDRGRPVAPGRVGEASTDSPCVRLVLRSWRMVRLEWILNSGNPSRHPVPERRRRGRQNDPEQTAADGTLSGSGTDRATHVRRPAHEQRETFRDLPGNDSGIRERDCGRSIIVLKQT